MKHFNTEMLERFTGTISSVIHSFIFRTAKSLLGSGTGAYPLQLAQAGDQPWKGTTTP